MYYIKKQFKFEAAHRLLNHKSKCKNIHGHNYYVWIYVKNIEDKLNNMSMVCDFSDLKILKDWLDEDLDHSLIINIKDKDLLNMFMGSSFKTCILNENPTAEYMSKYIYDNFNCLIKKIDNNLKVFKVEVYENLESIAVYED